MVKNFIRRHQWYVRFLKKLSNWVVEKLNKYDIVETIQEKKVLQKMEN